MGSDTEDIEEDGGSGLPSLTDIGRLLRKRKLIVGFCTALCGLTSLGFLSLLTPQYLATATVFIDPRDKNIANMKQVTSDLIANTPSIESETEIIHSTGVAGRVIDDLRLGEDAELTKPDGMMVKLKSFIKPWLGKPEAVHAQSLGELIEATAASTPGGDNVIEAFLGRVSAERLRETFLIEVDYKSRDPDKAARIANAIAEAYVQNQIETKMLAAQQATLWLDKQIAALRDKVYATEKSVSEFKAAHSLYDSEGHPLDEREMTRQMEQLILARNTTAETRAKYDNARQLVTSKSDITTVGEVLKANTITALKQQYADALRQQAAAASRYGPLHPNMVKADAQVVSTKAELGAEVDRIITNMKSEAEVAAQAQAGLEANLARMKAALSGNDAENVRLREMEREATAAREVYENFLKRAQETTQQQDFQSADARIVNRAIVPGAPVSPKKTLIVAGGFGGGLVLGLVLAVLIELLFPSFVRTEQIEKRLKLKHLTTISRFPEPRSQAGATLGQLRRVLLQPHSVFAESIRAIRVAIDRQRPDRRPQFVLVTSAMRYEGKSVIAANLALHCALSGVRTLLIDCDLTGGGLTPRLVPAANFGLYDCIMTRQPLRNAIMREAATGLHFLPALGQAAGPITPSDLLASPTLARAMLKLRGEFDIIVLDGRALVPSVDSRFLAELCDQIVFVNKWGDTSQAAAQQALRALGHSLPKVTGVVLNQVELDQLSSEVPLAPRLRYPANDRRVEPRLAA